MTYDAVVIGAGQGGVPLAEALSKAGRKVALIERADVGGTCVNRGCTPTKTMVASARIAYLARRAADYGVTTGEVSVDMARVRDRKRNIVTNFRAGGERRLARANVELIQGAARFTSRDTVEVSLAIGGTGIVTSKQWFIDTGLQPAVPDVPGIDKVAALDSTSIMELDAIPQHLAVLGGGYIGLEFAHMFRRFGSKVTIIEQGPHIIAREDEDVAAEMVKILKEDGIDIVVGATATRVWSDDGGHTISVALREGTNERQLDASHLLVATGRVPDTNALGLAAAGVETDARGFIRVTEKLETTAPGIFALGDVTGAPQFTHISYDHFRILRTNVIDGGNAVTTGRPVPYTVFTDPELGRVGLSEQQARAAGREIKIGKMQMSAVARALETDETRGLLKVVVDAKTGEILGCAMLAVNGGELMALVEVAMLGGLRYTALRDGIFAHPTFAEAMNNLFASADK
jgi:pyruvate/2-oxoglutarate dehydrogenase complex dihydrolipoamide dehydrogenase (E3) component